MKKWKKILLVTLLVPVLIITSMILPWLFMFLMSYSEPNPPKPEITYAEFPFRVEYRIEEESFIIEDTIVCEYNGVDWDEGQGKHREWKKTFKKTGKEDLHVLTDENTKIYLSIGTAQYYMGDSKYDIKYEKPTFYYVTTRDGMSISGGGGEELLDKYNIELIDWQLPKPIKNEFK